jgi:hypothetical protein
MRRPRVTIRILMTLVVVAAVGFWAGSSAWNVYRDKNLHLHIYAHLSREIPCVTFNNSASPPFWPRYWRHLMGRPWKDQPLCGTGEGHFEELCVFAHPEIDQKVPPGAFPAEFPPEVSAALSRLNEEWAQNHAVKAQK